MTKSEYLLTKLAEEALEVAHRAMKAMTFGLKQKQPGQPHTNEQRVMLETADLMAVCEMCVEEGVMPEDMGLPTADELIKLKKEKVREYMELSRALGTLHD